MRARSDMAKAFWYTAITTTIPVMALIGWVVGREYRKEILGALIGTFVGIFLVWFDVLRSEGVILRKKSKK